MIIDETKTTYLHAPGTLSAKKEPPLPIEWEVYSISVSIFT
jgi:hypothetical protein